MCGFCLGCNVIQLGSRDRWAGGTITPTIYLEGLIASFFMSNQGRRLVDVVCIPLPGISDAGIMECLVNSQQQVILRRPSFYNVIHPAIDRKYQGR
jgi:hypothetical protein